MKLRKLNWNVRRATAKSDAWKIFLDLNPDIATLQEVNSIPQTINNSYSVLYKNAINRKGKPQKCGTAILSKYPIDRNLKLISNIEWIDLELKYWYSLADL